MACTLTKPTCQGIIELHVYTGHDADGDAAFSVTIVRRYATPSGEWRRSTAMLTSESPLFGMVSDAAYHWVQQAQQLGDEIQSEPDSAALCKRP